MRVPEGEDLDYTASAFIVRDGKVLLMNHSKTGYWLQPGGHTEGEETLDETAKREVLEETGFRIRFHPRFMPSSEYDEEAEDLPRPFHVNLHRFNDDHWHCDFGFLALVDTEPEYHDSDEHDGLEWFEADELDGLHMPENVRNTALKALDIGEP